MNSKAANPECVVPSPDYDVPGRTAGDLCVLSYVVDSALFRVQLVITVNTFVSVRRFVTTVFLVCVLTLE